MSTKTESESPPRTPLPGKMATVITVGFGVAAAAFIVCRSPQSWCGMGADENRAEQVFSRSGGREARPWERLGKRFTKGVLSRR